MLDREIQRDLPAQIKPHRLHRPLIRKPIAIRQQQHLRQPARRDPRTTTTLRVTVREVLVAHNPFALLRKQHLDRALRQQLRAPHRIKEPLLPIRHRKHHASCNSKPVSVQSIRLCWLRESGEGVAARVGGEQFAEVFKEGAVLQAARGGRR
jgi:hypothetical protein